jgi:curved DNA-binding protein CbpA
MKTLYDLLGVRPDDDAEGLRNAFRKAAKANRAGLHAGDPDAPKRFGQIVEAYDILRDAEHRATYDRLLEVERGQLCSRLKRTVSYFVHNVVSDAIGVVGLAVVLAGGHALFAYISKTPADAVEVAARGPAEVAVIQPAMPTGMTGPDESRDQLERATVRDASVMTPGADVSAANGGTLEAAKSEPASISAGPGIEVAKADNAFAAPVDQDRARPGEVQFSSRKKDNGIPKSSSSDFAKSDDKHDIKIPDTRHVNTHDMKTPEMRITGKPRVEAKRQADSRAPVKQVALANRKTSCSGHQACSGDEPPLFGVGY